jgi:hypothetical protein
MEGCWAQLRAAYDTSLGGEYFELNIDLPDSMDRVPALVSMTARSHTRPARRSRPLYGNSSDTKGEVGRGIPQF